MAFSLRRKDSGSDLPATVRSSLGLLPNERVVAAARDDTGVWVVVGTARLYAVPSTGDGSPATGLVAARPWHLVDNGKWDHDNFTLTVTWVDGARPQQWLFRDSGGQVLTAFRERVQASVVISEAVDLGSKARKARVVIRKDLADGSLHDQTILGRGVQLSDSGVAEAVAATRAQLREQVGL